MKTYSMVTVEVQIGGRWAQFSIADGPEVLDRVKPRAAAFARDNGSPDPDWSTVRMFRYQHKAAA